MLVLITGQVDSVARKAGLSMMASDNYRSVISDNCSAKGILVKPRLVDESESRITADCSTVDGLPVEWTPVNDLKEHDMVRTHAEIHGIPSHTVGTVVHNYSGRHPRLRSLIVGTVEVEFPGYGCFTLRYTDLEKQECS